MYAIAVNAWAVSLFAHLICLIYLYALTLWAVNVVAKQMCVHKIALFKLLTCVAFDASKNKQELRICFEIEISTGAFIVCEIYFKCVS